MLLTLYVVDPQKFGSLSRWVCQITRVPLKKLGRSHFYFSNIFKQLLTPSCC